MTLLSYLVASTVKWSTERAVQLRTEVRNGWVLAYSDHDVKF